VGGAPTDGSVVDIAILMAVVGALVWVLLVVIPMSDR
jgi:hypothetical protein